MKTRIPKRPDTTRAHVQMPPEWRNTITDAANKLGMSRSSFIAHTAYQAARAEMALDKPPPVKPIKRSSVSIRCGLTGDEAQYLHNCGLLDPVGSPRQTYDGMPG